MKKDLCAFRGRGKINMLMNELQKMIDEIKSSNYILFMGNTFYPNGGMNDFYGFFTSVEDAVKYANDMLNENPQDLEWYQVLNKETFEIEAAEGITGPYVDEVVTGYGYK